MSSSTSNLWRCKNSCTSTGSCAWAARSERILFASRNPRQLKGHRELIAEGCVFAEILG